MQGLPLVFLLLLTTCSALQTSFAPLTLRSSSLVVREGNRYYRCKNIWCRPRSCSKSNEEEASVSEKSSSISTSIYGDAAATGAKEDLHDVYNSQTDISRRNLFRGAVWTTGMIVSYWGSGSVSCASASTSTSTSASISASSSTPGKTISLSGRLVDQVEPNEKETYEEAQNVNTPGGAGGSTQKRILWVGAGNMMRGVSANLFHAGNKVTALDLIRPDAKDIHAARRYATEYGYELRFEQGDATNLKYEDETFDVVVSSMFLCQDFDPEVVVSEIRRVLKPDGRFGFYEHVEDIDKVIIDKVFGERSVIRVQAYPEQTNVIAGIVKKV